MLNETFSVIFKHRGSKAYSENHLFFLNRPSLLVWKWGQKHINTTWQKIIMASNERKAAAADFFLLLQYSYTVRRSGKRNASCSTKGVQNFLNYFYMDFKLIYEPNKLFENYSKCRIWIFEFWHFPPIFVLLKLTSLVTLFDRKLQFFKNSPNWPF